MDTTFFSFDGAQLPLQINEITDPVHRQSLGVAEVRIGQFRFYLSAKAADHLAADLSRILDHSTEEEFEHD